MGTESCEPKEGSMVAPSSTFNHQKLSLPDQTHLQEEEGRRSTVGLRGIGVRRPLLF